MIEKRLVAQLGDRYEHAELIEISRDSYLISNKVRLPIFGRKEKIVERTRDSISKKGYLLKASHQFSTAHKYVLDPAHSLVMKSTAGGSLHGADMLPPPFVRQSIEGNQ